ncbi:MAG: 1-deoxy-D-xylulose-5-phosphate reductoisomerase [Clostridia bacterium]|nr:1-deoxy-D-xylulose-5-phosphate reductoisomerase [Clostridia bacterium]
MKKIAVLGCTGSVGTQTLEVIDKCGYRVSALVAHSDVARLESFAVRFKPEFVGLIDGRFSDEFIEFCDKIGCEYATGVLVMERAALCGDVICVSTAGVQAIDPIIHALNAGKTVALSNKESLVCAGEFIMEAAKNGNLIPVDSEHNAVFQLVEGRSDVKKIILTASGGAFFGKTSAELAQVTPEGATFNPNWKMGKKITVDSATLMNKGLEVIEACRLFGVEEKDVEVLVHRQSVVHSLVEFADGGVFALLNNPDMKYPIKYALDYPERTRSIIEPLDLVKLRELTFEKPDNAAFPSLEVARQAIRSGGFYPTVLTAADDCAVSAFLNGKILFTQIPEVIDSAMQKYRPCEDYGVTGILREYDRVKAFTQKELFRTNA